MDLRLDRKRFTPDGIFGELWGSAGLFVGVTLEHSYDGQPKIPPGSYVCKRGTHTLEHHPEPFETFEILGIPGHTNILIHVGNYNADSEGCLLIGRVDMGNMITNSKETFAAFLELEKGVDTFQLVVENPALT